MNFGAGMESRSAVTAWDPPRMFAAQGEGWVLARRRSQPSGASKRARGVCASSVWCTASLPAPTTGTTSLKAPRGWPGFFRTLRIYLTHFRGQRSAIAQFVAPVAGTEAEGWETLTAALGVEGVSVGQRWTAPAGVPALSGVAEYVSQSPYDALLRLDKPGPGVAALGAFSFPGGQSMVAVNFYLYGDQAAETVAHVTPLWQAWIQERFPMPSETSQSA